MAHFDFTPDDVTAYAVEWDTPGLTVLMDTLGIAPQLVPASAIGLSNFSIQRGTDKEFQVQVLQADGITPFSLAGIPIHFYAKLNQSDTTYVFFKTIALNSGDILVPNPVNGIIQVFVRAADYASIAVGTTMFFYVDVVNAAGGTQNVAKWTVTITY